MGQRKFSTTVLVVILIALFFGIAFYFRVAPVYDTVFGGDCVRFTESDAYYHMRLVDNLLNHFPQRITFDPYTYYPYGTRVPWPPLVDWLIAGIAWLFGLGSANQHVVDNISAYIPAIAGAAAVILVYFLGKELFNRWVGVLAAGLMAIQPGEFFMRSRLGFVDHHAFETLFLATTIFFFILSLKAARQRCPTFGDIGSRGLSSAAKPLLYGCLSGIFLGLYLLTWPGGPFLILLLLIYLVVQCVIDHLRGESSDYLVIAAYPALLIGGAIALPFSAQIWSGWLFVLALSVALLLPAVLIAISKLMTGKGIRRIYYPLTIAGLGLVGLAVLWISSPSLFSRLLWPVTYILPLGIKSDIWEVQPLLFGFGKFSLSCAWDNFTTGFFLSFISLGMLCYMVVKRSAADKTLLLVWSLFVLFATLGQRRYAYYFAVNVALLVGYLSWWAIDFASKGMSLRTQSDKPKTVSGKRNAVKETQRTVPGGVRSWRRMTLALIGVIVIVFIPNVTQTMENASQQPFTPDDAWYESLSWMRDNTPEPFGNPDFYYELYQAPQAEEAYDYPESAYGVTAWWSYGHWITRIARRIPTSNPFQKGVVETAKLLVAQDEASSEAIIDEMGAKYVIVDTDTAAGFFGKATWAGLDERDFYDIYYERQGNLMVPVLLLYPEYYRSLCVRLYNFEGKEIIPDSCNVISYQEKVAPNGKIYKAITDSQTFSTYEEAEKYISEQKSGDYKIVGRNPFVSPVPLEELEHYRLVYASEVALAQQGVGMVPEVKIFEYER